MSAARGMAIVSSTCVGSTTSTDLTALGSAPQDGQTLFGSNIRSRLALTAMASKGVPSVKSTLVRSANVQVMASADSFQEVASAGWIFPVWSSMASDSIAICSMFDTLVVVWRIGSSVSGSTPSATVSTEDCWDWMADAMPPFEPHAASIVVAATMRPMSPGRLIPTPLSYEVQASNVNPVG